MTFQREQDLVDVACFFNEDPVAVLCEPWAGTWSDQQRQVDTADDDGDSMLGWTDEDRIRALVWNWQDDLALWIARHSVCSCCGLDWDGPCQICSPIGPSQCDGCGTYD